MRRLIMVLLVTLLAGPLGGCYLGRTQTRKAIAYVTNGSLLVVGVAGIASAQGQHDDAGIASGLSAIPLVVGLIGIAINASIATQADPVER